jgi:hypothetical protein
MLNWAGFINFPFKEIKENIAQRGCLMRKFALLLFFVAFWIPGCGSSSINFTPTPSGNAAPTPAVDAAPTATGIINFQVGFSELVNNTLTTVDQPTDVSSVRFSLAQADRTDVVGPTTLSLAELTSGNRVLGQGSSMRASFSNVPLLTPLLLRVEAFNGVGDRVYDYERKLILNEDGQVFSIILTPIEAFRSGVFFTVPYLRLNGNVELFLQDRADDLLQQGSILGDRILGYSPSPCSGWTLEIGPNTYTVGPLGRARLLSSDLNGQTTATLRHPTDTAFSSTVQLSELGQGQITSEAFVLAFQFEGGCNMDERTDNDAFCGQPLALPDAPSDLVGIVAQVIKEILPASQNTSNRCRMRVPQPTQFEERERGTYPQPKIFFSDGSIRLFQTQSLCEQTNGGVGPDETVLAEDRGSRLDYINSTCHRYVAFGCCPNENALSDLENVPRAVLAPVLEAGFDLAGVFFDVDERNILDPAIIPRDTLSCPDNHGGRQCQELLIGDVSLDFTFSGRAGVQFPDEPEAVVLVAPGERIPFVLHNNGCFGRTIASSTKREIRGSVRRTFREFALSPVENSAQATLPKLQVSTDPLLGGVPTAGRNVNLTPITSGTNRTPAAPNEFGVNGVPTAINHTQIDDAIPQTAKGTNFSRYRYFPDLAMEYVVPANATPGQEDRYLFTVDDCPVPVTFRVAGPDELPPVTEPTEPTPSPTPTTQPPPDLINVGVSQVDETHIVGTSPCPQELSDIPIVNRTEEEITVTITADSPLFVDSTSFTLLAGTGAAFPTLFFDCSTTTSFSATVTITATGLAGTETVTIPVNVTIQN